MITRRNFNKGLVSLAFGGLFTHINVKGADLVNTAMDPARAYGPILPDPEGILDLPKGFSYRVISTLGSAMSDGLKVPDRADGMGCLPLDDDRVVLVRNHEISPPKASAVSKLPQALASSAYDADSQGHPLPGGTSNIVYNLKTEKVEQEFMSLLGTIRNCAGGVTPWNSWLTCEESVLTASEHIGQDHGYVFEVPAQSQGLVAPVPLKEMGRFNQEAACVDPRTGIVYMTEDRGDSLFYRFIPNVRQKLDQGGKLQALVVKSKPMFDTRNWQNPDMPLHQEFECEWIDLEDVESPKDDLRQRGYTSGAALFARGEGLHFGEDEMYFCCTNGGAKKLGQIMRYKPSEFEGESAEQQSPGKLSLFVESVSEAAFNYGDNVAIAPNGHLIVCEDQYSDEVNNKLRGVTTDGRLYDFAKVRWQTEPAGACFSPDGQTMFVNLYSPTLTLAITGPWDQFVG